MKTLTYAEAADILKQAVAERGSEWMFPGLNECPTCTVINWEDYEPCPWHYDGGCRYFSDDGAPACLVGYVIDKAVPDRKTLPMQQIEANHALDALNYLHNWGALVVDDRTAEMLYRAQQLQDEGTPWGVAVSEAIKQVPEV